ncbi:MAG: 16S rRNA (cytosine(1402)-N(4))-methyltransferase RsmH [Phycisphaeraceae bacterium]
MDDVSSEADGGAGGDAGHVPVLLNEVLSLLDLDRDRPGARVLDCTLGRGGHASQVIPRLGPGGVYVGMDLDAGNLAFAEARLSPIAAAAGVDLRLCHASFAAGDRALREAGLEAVDAVLADLGFASNQVEDASRGFSFKHDGPLDMRLDPSGPTTAGDLVNRLDESSLADLIYRLGDERLSRRIARKIVQSRGVLPISRTSELAEICRRSYGPRGGGRIDPATRTFQALRIAVNGELEALDVLLRRLPGWLADDGLVGIISFHSLEDRPVKRSFLEAQQRGVMQRVTRKPVTATESEQARNPRSRSAKLRVARRAPRRDDTQDENPAAPHTATGPSE